MAQVRFEQPLKSRVPAHHRAFDRRWQALADECDARAAEDKLKTAGKYDCTAKRLSRVWMGHYILVFDRTGVINGAGNFKSYLVKMPSLRLY